MRIEAIFRESTIKDIQKYWKATGRTVTADTDGQAVFENVTDWGSDAGTIWIQTSDNGIFIYNIRDFYRFKIIE